MNMCLGCGQLLDASTCVGEDAGPTEGDVTVCLACGHIMVFGRNLVLRNPSDDEIADIAGDERVLEVQRARKRAGIT
jgi:hypothetical protein